MKIKYEKNEQYKEDLIKSILIQIGENPNREGLRDTPKRVVKMWSEIFRGYRAEPPKITTFDNGSDGIVYDELITVEGTFHSYCEHHIVPFSGRFFFAFLPHPKGKLIGLSKVPRVVDYFSARLQIQERLTHEIIDYIWNLLCNKNVCKYAPLGMGLTMEAEHLCKSMRGVKNSGKMRTTKLLGVIKTDTKARNEFVQWINSRGVQ